jgi:hypothetical protein
MVMGSQVLCYPEKVRETLSYVIISATSSVAISRARVRVRGLGLGLQNGQQRVRDHPARRTGREMI